MSPVLVSQAVLLFARLDLTARTWAILRVHRTSRTRWFLIRMGICTRVYGPMPSTFPGTSTSTVQQGQTLVSSLANSTIRWGWLLIAVAIYTSRVEVRSINTGLTVPTWGYLARAHSARAGSHSTLAAISTQRLGVPVAQFTS